jgi:hypothetical protein
LQQQVASWTLQRLQLLLFQHSLSLLCFSTRAVCLLHCAGSINDAYSPAWRAGEPSPEQAAELLEDVITSEPLVQ